MKYVLLCLLVSFLPACSRSSFGLAVKAPLFGELQFRSDPVNEAADGILTATDAVGLTGPDEK